MSTGASPQDPPAVRALGRVALHPVLLAAYPALLLWGLNVHEVQASEVWPAVWRPVVGALLVWAVAAAALRSVQRGAVVASVTVAVVLNAGRLTAVPDTPLLVGAGAVILGGVVVAALMRNSVLVPLTAVGNVMAVVLVALAVPSLVSGTGSQAVAAGPTEGTSTTREATGDAAGAVAGRDIWYIIPDRYPRADTLTEQYEFDNGSFLGHLEDLGFQVAEESLTNYPKTAHSLAATWNLDTLDVLVPTPPADGNDWRPLYDLLEDHRLGRLLTEIGYEYIHLGSWWGPTASADPATKVVRVDDRSEFEAVWETQTILPLLGSDDDDDAQRRSLHELNLHYSRFQLDELDRLAARRSPGDGPQLVLAHITLPHGPYVYDAQGNHLSEQEASDLPEDEAFLGQVQYLNTRLEALVDRLTSGPPETWPVIVIQSDEGPNPAARQVEGPSFDFTTATDAELVRKMRTLSAILLPESDVVLPEDLTGVDTWRRVLDAIIGTGFGPLDEVPLEVFRGEDEMYDLFDVTDRVS